MSTPSERPPEVVRGTPEDEAPPLQFNPEQALGAEKLEEIRTLLTKENHERGFRGSDGLYIGSSRAILNYLSLSVGPTDTELDKMESKAKAFRTTLAEKEEYQRFQSEQTGQESTESLRLPNNALEHFSNMAIDGIDPELTDDEAAMARVERIEARQKGDWSKFTGLSARLNSLSALGTTPYKPGDREKILDYFNAHKEYTRSDTGEKEREPAEKLARNAAELRLAGVKPSLSQADQEYLMNAVADQIARVDKSAPSKRDDELRSLSVLSSYMAIIGAKDIRRPEPARGRPLIVVAP